ncbi:putative reverse transcriptase domain-containing protein [Tanacetum coccineum]|uniref:Reverse transcriptase domain-containing protein n=1 Tax=Tanacetum coccineum TaxID=301880 RepID=A0ABQ5C5Q7_9ASTR
MTSRPRTRVFRPGPVWGCDRLVSRAKVIENQVMVAPIISISSDSSEESVPIVPADPIVTPEVGTVLVVSPAGVLDLVDYSSSSDSDPSEDSLPPAPDLPLVSPFLCSDDSEADDESEPAEQRPERHESLTVHDAEVSRWRDKVASRPSTPSGPSSHDILAPSSEFPLAPIVAPPGIRRRSATLIRPGEAIPFGRPYRTHPNGPRKLLTARKRVRPLPARRLAWRRVSHHSSDHHSSPDSSSSSSSSDPSSVHSSTCDSSGQAHSGPSTRDVPSRLIYPPVLTPRYSSSSERSLDSSSPSSRPSRKRCRPPTASDTVDAKVVIDVEAVADVEFELRLVATDTREIAIDPLAIGDSSKSSRGGIPDLEDTIYDIVHYMSEEEFHQVRRDSDDTRRRLRRTMTITRYDMTPEAIEELVNRHMEEALAAHEATRAANALEAKNQSQNGSDSDNGNGGNGNGENGNGGNGNPNENGRGDRPVARECTYQDFMKCQPLNFKGTEGVVGLIRWFEKMETVFHISNYPEKSQVKYATCTLLNSALSWWNSHKRTIGTDAAFAMSWRELMKLMTEVYCPRNEIQKMESELWNLTVKNNDLAAYTQRFQELTMLCTKMVPEEEDRVERYIGGLPDNIQGNVIAAEPTRLQDAVRIANNLMDQKLKGYAVKNAENKRRLEVNQRDNHGQQPPFKRPNDGGQNVARAYTAGNNKKKPYNGLLPFCNKCKLHHEGPCTRGQVVNQRVVTCFECGRQGHFRSDCPKLKDQNRRNKAGNKNGVGEARGKAYVLGGGDANPDSYVIKGTFLLNNLYAFILFDSGADRSFVSTTFSTLLDITPDTLDVSYAVELADGRFFRQIPCLEVVR